jgi:hypothetical protein
MLTTANSVGTNGLMCLPKNGGARDKQFLVTHPKTDQRCLASTIARRAHKPRDYRAPQIIERQNTSLYLGWKINQIIKVCTRLIFLSRPILHTCTYIDTTHALSPKGQQRHLRYSS